MSILSKHTNSNDYHRIHDIIGDNVVRPLILKPGLYVGQLRLTLEEKQEILRWEENAPKKMTSTQSKK